MPACWPDCPASRWSASSIRCRSTARATDLVGCRAFETPRSNCFAEGVDAVTIAAPTHLHHEIALACIARNIHILVEKPVASTVEEGREIVAAAQQRRRDADGRPCRALQSGGRRDQAGDLGRGHPVDRHHPRRPVPAADVQCRRRDRSRRARHRPDPLVHRVRHRRGAAAALERGRRARGHRAAAVPHRLRRARPHQHQLADAVQGAQRHGRDPRQVCDGRSADRARSPNASASSRTAAIRCVICRSATTSRCAPS